MLLRDGTTWVTLKILARDHRNRLCDQDRWLAYGFQLSPGLPLFLDSRGPNEPYVVDRLDVVNLDRLNNKERQQVAERWARMSTAEKNEHAKRVADAIRSINGSVEIATKQFREDQASQREFNQRLQRQEEESAAALNEMLIGKIGELYQESARINAQNLERSQQPGSVPMERKRRKLDRARRVREQGRFQVKLAGKRTVICLERYSSRLMTFFYKILYLT